MEQQAISSDLIRGHIDTIILHTLLDGDKFAQQISDTIDAKSGNEYKINQATLYSSLKRLETLKHVSSYWNDAESGRRKFFKLTDLGKNTVESNLANWSFSRAIIDKLMDCQSEPVYKTQYVEVEKIVEKVVEVPVNVPVEVEKVVEVVKEVPVEVQDSPSLSPQVSSQGDVTSDTTQEINFRNILNGLIKATAVPKQQVTELEPINRIVEKEEKSTEKLKFNETISSNEFNTAKANVNGKIDFGDLMLKAAKEGYKIRISSKDSGVPIGNLFINKLNLCSSAMIYLLAMLEFLFFTFYYKSVLGMSPIATVLCVLALSIFPLYEIIKFLKTPNKTTSKNITADIILTAAIVVFNLLLVTLAVSLLVNVDFSNTKTVLIALVMPCVLYADALGYFIIKFLISKMSIFNVKHKKTA